MGKDDLKSKDFFWLVRDHEGTDLDPGKHVEVVERNGMPSLVCKTRVVGLQVARNKEGKLGIIIYVEDGEAPAVTGTVFYG